MSQHSHRHRLLFLLLALDLFGVLSGDGSVGFFLSARDFAEDFSELRLWPLTSISWGIARRTVLSRLCVLFGEGLGVVCFGMRFPERMDLREESLEAADRPPTDPASCSNELLLRVPTSSSSSMSSISRGSDLTLRDSRLIPVEIVPLPRRT